MLIKEKNKILICKLIRTKFSKTTILVIMKFLKLNDIVRLGMTCDYLNNVYRYLWFEGDYFRNLDTKLFSEKEIQIICKKSKQIQSKVLNNLLSGKKLKHFLKNNHIKLMGKKNTRNCENLQSFHINPVKSNGQIHILFDHDLKKILKSNGNDKSLQSLSLIKCPFVRKLTFEYIPNLKNLHMIQIVANPNLLDCHIQGISKKCIFLTNINFSNCSKLTERSLFDILGNCTFLKELNLSFNPAVFKDINSFNIFEKPLCLKIIVFNNINIEQHKVWKIISKCKNLKKAFFKSKIIRK